MNRDLRRLPLRSHGLVTIQRGCEPTRLACDFDGRFADDRVGGVADSSIRRVREVIEDPQYVQSFDETDETVDVRDRDVESLELS